MTTHLKDESIALHEVWGIAGGLRGDCEDREIRSHLDSTVLDTNWDSHMY